MKEYNTAKLLYSTTQRTQAQVRTGLIKAPFALAFVNRCINNNIPIGAALSADIIGRLHPQHERRNQLETERQAIYNKIFNKQTTTTSTSTTSTTTTTTKQQKKQTFNVNIINNNSTTTTTSTTTSTTMPAKLEQVRHSFFPFLFNEKTTTIRLKIV